MTNNRRKKKPTLDDPGNCVFAGAGVVLAMIAIPTAALLLSAPLAEQEVQRFRVEVNRVYVDVFVRREGESARPLGSADFEVFHEGVKQEVHVVNAQTVPRSFASWTKAGV